MTIDLSHLKEVAGKATAGPWKLFRTSDGLRILGVGEATGEGITDFRGGLWRSGPEAVANGEHIAAADPQTVLALVAVVEAARACRDAWVTEAKAAGYALNLETAAGLLCDYETKLVLALSPFGDTNNG